jgi:hypothetical protein
MRLKNSVRTATTTSLSNHAPYDWNDDLTLFLCYGHVAFKNVSREGLCALVCRVSWDYRLGWLPVHTFVVHERNHNHWNAYPNIRGDHLYAIDHVRVWRRGCDHGVLRSIFTYLSFGAIFP